jgi:hypothetical protein
MLTLAIAYLVIWLPDRRRAGSAPAPAWAWPARLGVARCVGDSCPLFALGVMRTIADSFSPFLYFRF